MLLIRIILIYLVYNITVCLAYRRPNGLRHSHHYHGIVHNHFGSQQVADGEQNNGEEDQESGRGGHKYKKPDKVYTFQVGDNFGPYEYMDVTDGFLKGFHVDLIKAVCKEAGKTCYPVVDIYSNCWDSEGDTEVPGKGLMGGWYDGCVGLMPSPERLNSFNFSLPYTPNTEAAMFYRSGQNPNNFHNLTGKRIGFIKGWAVGLRCLSRQLDFIGNVPRRFTPVGFDSHETMLTALQVGELDAMLTVTAYIPPRMELVESKPHFQCTTSGTSMMARYGDDVIEWWNDAFIKLQSSGKFGELCAESQKEHGLRGQIDCIE